MSNFRMTVMLLAACAAVPTLGTHTVAAQVPSATTATAQAAWTRVTYVTGNSIYLEIGSRDGLREGMALEVVRGGVTIAELAVAFLSSTRASCTITRQTHDPAVGDSVLWMRPAVTVATTDSAGLMVARATPGSETARASRSKSHEPPPIRGRIGLRYLVLSPDGAGGLTQPAYDVRLDGNRLGGTSLALTVDARAQRTIFAASPTSAARPAQSLTRVYQASLAWVPTGSAPRLTVGRQFAAALSSVGLFDGVALDLDRSRWSLGAFAGNQPDAASFGLSSLVREQGMYGQVHNAIGKPNPWSLTLGGVGSYHGGQIDREYGFARLTAIGRRYSVYATQELDVNRGWKRTQEGHATTPTASFATLYLTPVDELSIFAGFDNRRNVRLYRDFISPEIAFDDSFRMGTWGGLSWAPMTRLRMSADMRQSGGGTAGQARSVTGTVGMNGLTPARFGWQARLTSYNGDLSAGRLESGSVEVNPMGRFRFSVNGGQRSTLARATLPPSTMRWYGADSDFGIGRSLYLLLSWYREMEAGRGTTQGYLSLSWRF